ncbi:MAG: chromosome segregation ATPase [Bacteroidia bacterium]|jgi:chromosome segregation ATPase
MAQDPPEVIPSIVPVPEDGRGARGSRSRRGNNSRRGGQKAPSSGGSGILARLFITLALVVAAVACAWAWQLQQALQGAERVMDDYSLRISDLEDRLSDTDEGMAQSSQVQAVKIKELDQEVRKLWDNVWKSSKERLGKLEATDKKYGPQISGLQGDMSTVQTQLKADSADLDRLKGVAGDLSRLMGSAKANQTEVERVADTLNRIELEMNRLSKRVQTNEEWVGSINAFRKQVNASLLELRNTVSSLQATP